MNRKGDEGGHAEAPDRRGVSEHGLEQLLEGRLAQGAEAEARDGEEYVRQGRAALALVLANGFFVATRVRDHPTAADPGDEEFEDHEGGGERAPDRGLRGWGLTLGALELALEALELSHAAIERRWVEKSDRRPAGTTKPAARRGPPGCDRAARRGTPRWTRRPARALRWAWRFLLSRWTDFATSARSQAERTRREDRLLQVLRATGQAQRGREESEQDAPHPPRGSPTAALYGQLRLPSTGDGRSIRLYGR